MAAKPARSLHTNYTLRKRLQTPCCPHVFFRSTSQLKRINNHQRPWTRIKESKRWPSCWIFFGIFFALKIYAVSCLVIHKYVKYVWQYGKFGRCVLLRQRPNNRRPMEIDKYASSARLANGKALNRRQVRTADTTKPPSFFFVFVMESSIRIASNGGRNDRQSTRKTPTS